MNLKEFKEYSAEAPEVMEFKKSILDKRSEVRERLYTKPDLRHLFSNSLFHATKNVSIADRDASPVFPRGFLLIRLKKSSMRLRKISTKSAS